MIPFRDVPTRVPGQDAKSFRVVGVSRLMIPTKMTGQAQNVLKIFARSRSKMHGQCFLGRGQMVQVK